MQCIYTFYYDFDGEFYDYEIEEMGVVDTLIEILSEKPEFEDKSEEEIKEYIYNTGVKKLVEKYEKDLTDALEELAYEEFKEDSEYIFRRAS